MGHGHEGEPGADGTSGRPVSGQPPGTAIGAEEMLSGMARLEQDVVTLPADQQALGLVEAILSETRVGPYQDRELGEAHFLKIRLSIIQGNGERLKVLLEKGNEARLLKMLKEIELGTTDHWAEKKAAAAIEAAS